MKMVKSLLLGSAAGLVAVTTGQAADLPVKAKPVEYVKVCSLYGAGFYYMPGTDVCIKIGGWVRYEAGYGANGNFTTTWAGDTNQRSTNNLTMRARGYITADARDQTAYGTARGYIAVGLSTNSVGLDNAANQFSANRAFVQWAGFTAGLAQSFYDFYSVPATAYWGAYPASDTGDPGWLVFGYTAQLGNGLSATISDEARRVAQIIDQNGVTLAGGGSIQPGGFLSGATFTSPTAVGGTNVAGVAVGGAGGVVSGAGAYGGQQFGDVVGNLRVDQAWGSAQVMAALHEVNASYYSAGATNSGPNVANGHPGDEWGWAAGAGFKILAPFVSQGDFFQTQVNYTEGALKYLISGPAENYGMAHGGRGGFGIMADGVYGGVGSTGSSVQLTSAWGFNAAYEHYWVPSLKTSLYGGYDKITYNAQANAMLCSAAAFGSGSGTAAAATAGCNTDWSIWFLGSRTQWDVTKNFYMGVDVLYEDLRGGSTPTGLLGGFWTGLPATTAVSTNQSNWAFRFRMHRDFLP